MKLNNRLLDRYDTHRIVLFMIIIASLIQIAYLSIATRNVPFMDYWGHMANYLDNAMQGGLSWTQLWNSATEQRVPMMFISMAANAKLFGLNTRVEIFAGFLMMLANTLLIYKIYVRTTLDKTKKIAFILFIPIILLIFSGNQWEIITTQFSFVIMLKLFMFTTIYYMIDRLLQNTEKNKKRIAEIILFVFITVCSVATAFFPAMMGAVGTAIILHIILKKNDRKYMKTYILIFAGLIFSGLFYMWGANALAMEGQDISIIFTSLFDGNLIKGLLLMMGATIVHTNIMQVFGLLIVYLAGAFVFTISIYAIYLFFKTKMYEKTYIPIMFMVYGFISMLLLFVGRYGLFGELPYLTSSRYTCDTIVALIGIIWIYAYSIKYSNFNFRKPIVIISMLPIIAVSAATFVNNLSESVYAPYRGIYFQGILDTVLMDDITLATDAQIAATQATNREVFENGVNIMKKYDLGVFRNLPSDEQRKQYDEQKIGNTLTSIKKIDGFNSDGWVSKKVNFDIRSKKSAAITILGYYPGIITGNEKISILVNDTVQSEYTLTDSNIEMKLDIPLDEIANVKLISNFEMDAKGDSRELAFVMTSVSAS